MRFFYGFIALFLWALLCIYLFKSEAIVSIDMQFLTAAIVVAGAMAGGD